MLLSPEAQAIHQQLCRIYKDLTNNVTGIVDRQSLHFAYDLVYHSVLSFNFDGYLIKKGWLEGLVVGDTKCGKTQAAERLIQHYQLGAFCPAEGSSYAGLVGACEQPKNGKWRIKWGKIPYNDGRLLFIDEVSGIDPEQIAMMSSMRSSGIAELSKAAAAKANARTRLVWISNPSNHYDEGVGSAAYGVSIIQDIIGQPEDISRFDFAIIVSADEVNDDIVNSPLDRHVPHVYTSEMCRNLVMWAWTRKVKDIIISTKTTDACRAYSKEMYNKYSKDFPIVNAGEQRFKMARMATALACRLFSTDDGVRVIVKPEHVEYIHWWLNTEFDRRSFAYDKWSSRRRKNLSIVNQEAVDQVLANFGPQVVDQLLNTEQIGFHTVVDIHGSNAEIVRPWFATLLQNNALVKYNSYYRKTSAGIEIMKRYLRSPSLVTGEY
jgi:hypothetical protein